MSGNLDIEYSPSEWSKRLNSKEVLEQHLKFVTEVTQQNRVKYQLHANVPYGTSSMEKMDIYFKNVACGNSILVYIHGGYWQMLNKDVSAYCVGPLVENGFRVIVLDYAICPNVTLEEIICQIKKAARTIFAYADRTGAKSISFCGHSAGAHLIACLLEDTENLMTIPNINLLKSVFLISGIYDIRPIYCLKSVNPNNILSLNENTIQKLSPLLSNYEHLMKLCNFKCFIYVAENDSISFQKQSENYHKHLQKFSINSNYQIIKNVDHFDIVENLVCPKLSPIAKQIIEQLK